jgi:hypothetical protein
MSSSSSPSLSSTCIAPFPDSRRSIGGLGDDEVTAITAVEVRVVLLPLLPKTPLVAPVPVELVTACIDDRVPCRLIVSLPLLPKVVAFVVVALIVEPGEILLWPVPPLLLLFDPVVAIGDRTSKWSRSIEKSDS